MFLRTASSLSISRCTPPLQDIDLDIFLINILLKKIFYIFYMDFVVEISNLIDDQVDDNFLDHAINWTKASLDLIVDQIKEAIETNSSNVDLIQLADRGDLIQIDQIGFLFIVASHQTTQHYM